jgi:hypothetical protein
MWHIWRTGDSRGRIRGPAAPMHLGRTNGSFVHCFYFPLSSPEALHVQQRERPLSVKDGSMGEKWPIQFCLQRATSTVSVGIFYMPQIYDMGQTASLLPLGRKAC